MDSPKSTEDNNPEESPAENSEASVKPKMFTLFNAKCSLLSKCREYDVNNIYEHLITLIKKVLKEESIDDIGEFEDLSLLLKRFKYPVHTPLLASKSSHSPEEKLAKNRETLFKSISSLKEPAQCPDFQKIFSVFEQAGLGLTKDEMITLLLSVRNFSAMTKCKGLRFWGKIFGRKANYYILEADNDTISSDVDKKPDETLVSSLKNEASTENALDSLNLDLTPKPEWKPPPEVPAEDSGRGLNRKVYYICSVLGEPWIKLPDVLPTQGSVSRMILHICTGDLEAKVETYPPFPGVEKHYLRAQIARITANTTISPINYYQFDEDEEEGEMEEDAYRESFIENPDYEPVSIFELSDPSLVNWVHHAPYILPQGRAVWWNPTQKSGSVEDDENEDEEDEELEEADEPEPETGPPLLTPLSEDSEVNGLPPWSTRITSRLIPHYAYAVLSSNQWPGAHAVAAGRLFENIYIGWAQKYAGISFSPQPIPEVFTEFPSGPETTEAEDPTPEEEAAWRAAQAEAAERAAKAEQDEDEEEDEEEAEEEDEGSEDEE